VTPTETSKNLGVLLRVGVFALIAMLGYFIFPILLIFLLGDGVLWIVATLGTFATAAVAPTSKLSPLRACSFPPEP
jgi:hypothetical protein